MSLQVGNLIIPQWPAPSQVRAFATTRAGGVSHAPYASLNLGAAVGDDPERVKENRARVRALLPNEPCWLKQVHGTTVIALDHAIDVAFEADASCTRQPHIVCAVQMADCLPVLIAAQDGSAVAAAHAGWRGLAAGVIENTVAAMQKPPQQLLAWLGPAIGPNAFEVGEDVRHAFLANDAGDARAFVPHAENKWLADLFTLARSRLHRLGVTAVFGGGLCTYSDTERFFSHRRDRVSGRMAAVIWIDR